MREGITNEGKYLCKMELNFTLKKLNEAAQQLLSLAPSAVVFAFHGEMGAGKTTIIHAMCEAMGVIDPVTSPTFSIINQYKTHKGKIVYHVDLYRLKDADEAINTGIEDCLYSGNTCLVEWPEKALSIFPPDTLHLYITAIDNDTRRIVLDMPTM